MESYQTLGFSNYLQRFSDIINIHRPFVFARKSALRLGIVSCSIFIRDTEL